MNYNLKKCLQALIVIVIIPVMLYSCSATIKIPKHPGPGEPPTPPKVEIHNN